MTDHLRTASASTPEPEEQPVSTEQPSLHDVIEAQLRPIVGAPALTDNIIRALTAAGFEVMAPQDLSWGTCPETGEPHYVSLSLCSGCLQYDPD